MYYDLRCSEDVQLASLPSPEIATELDEKISPRNHVSSNSRYTS